MPTVKLLAGLRRFGGAQQTIAGATVREVLALIAVPEEVLFPEGDGRLNRDIEVLVNGRNIAFLEDLDTAVSDEDRVTIFLHGARGYPGG